MALLGLPAERVSAIPLAADLNFRRVPEREIGRFLNSKDIPDRYVLSVATIEPRKNLRALLGAMSLLPKDVTLVCAGWSGWMSEDFQRTIQRLGLTNRIIWLGHVTDHDLRVLYSGARVMAYPSLYEGFGNALLEAFYFRKPLLVNRYSIFVSDIEPRGARVTTMNGYVTRDVIEQVKRVIEDEQHRKEIVDHNYEMGKSFFSYTVLRRKLRSLITYFTGADDL